MSREEAYAVVQRNSMKAADDRRQFARYAGRGPGCGRPPVRRSPGRLFDESTSSATSATAIARLMNSSRFKGGRRCRPLRW